VTPEEEEAQLRWLDAQDDAKAVADTILRAYPELRVTKGAIGGLSPAFDSYMDVVRREFAPLAAKHTADVAAGALILVLSGIACYSMDVSAAKEGKTRYGYLDDFKKIEEWKKENYWRNDSGG
jgi:hypothetical protein